MRLQNDSDTLSQIIYNAGMIALKNMIQFALYLKSLVLLALIIVSSFLYATDDKVWISIDKRAYDHLSNSVHSPFSDTSKAYLSEHKSIEGEDLVIVAVDQKNIALLSLKMHTDFKRCGGFIAHESFEKAKASLQPLTKAHGQIGYSIDNPDTVSTLLSQLSVHRLENTVVQMGSYFDRYYVSETGVESAEWLRDHWQSISASRPDIRVELIPHSRWAQPSVMVTIEGTSIPEEYVVIGGHLDSINSRYQGSGQAPGMDDNASGISVVTELLEVMIRSNYYPARTIKLYGYAAEEVGLLGSAEIANNMRSNNVNVVGAAQFDMTSYFGTPTQDIVLIRDYTDSAQNDFMAALMDTYLPELVYGYDLCGYGCSDHASWNNAGYRASFPFEARFLDSNPRIHTTADDYFDPSHMMKFASLAATYTAELAKGQSGNNTPLAVMSFTGAQATVTSGDSLTIAVERTSQSAGDVSVDYSTANISAIAGTDYTAVSGTLTWLDGDTEAKEISVETSQISGNRQFSISLANPSDSAILSSDYRVTVTIQGSVVTTPEPTQPTSQGGGSGSIGFLILTLVLAFLHDQRCSIIRIRKNT